MTLLFAPDCNHSNVIAAIVDGHFIQSFFVGMSGKGQIMFAGHSPQGLAPIFFTEAGIYTDFTG